MTLILGNNSSILWLVEVHDLNKDQTQAKGKSTNICIKEAKLKT